MLENSKNVENSANIKMQNCSEPSTIFEGLGYAFVGCAMEKKKTVGILKHFVKFRGINLCRRLIFDKLAIKWPTKMVGSKVFYVSCFENVFSGSHNSRVAKLPPV